MANVFTTENFDAEVLQSDMPVLVDFFADWCGPCKMMSPMVEAFADQYEGKIKIGKINVDENPEIAQRYSVMSIPTFIYFKGGEVVDKAIGALPKETFEKAIEKVIG